MLAKFLQKFIDREKKNRRCTKVQPLLLLQHRPEAKSLVERTVGNPN